MSDLDWKPRLASGVRLAAPPDDVSVAWLPPDRYFRLSEIAFALLADLDGQRTITDLAERLASKLGQTVSPEQLAAVIRERLAPSGLVVVEGVEADDGPRPARRPWSKRIASPALTKRLALLLSPLYSRSFRVLGVLAILGVAIWCSVAIASNPTGGYLDGWRWVWAYVLLLSLFAMHELGHAAALLAAGGDPGETGLSRRGGHFVFYVDTSQAWLLARSDRVWIDLGGVVAQAWLTLAALAVAASDPGVQLACLLSVLATVENLVPHQQSDGEWLHGDLPPRARPWLRPVLAVCLLALVAWPVRIAFGQVWDEIGLQWQSGGEAESLLDRVHGYGAALAGAGYLVLFVLIPLRSLAGLVPASVAAKSEPPRASSGPA